MVIKMKLTVTYDNLGLDKEVKIHIYLDTDEIENTFYLSYEDILTKVREFVFLDSSEVNRISFEELALIKRSVKMVRMITDGFSYSIKERFDEEDIYNFSLNFYGLDFNTTLETF